MTWLLLLAGLCLLIAGAYKLVDASVAIARHSGMSEMMIGAVVIGTGVSLPELFVSTAAVLPGRSDIALGNVLGSNLCNGALILGITAIISSVKVTMPKLRRDIPIVFFATLLVMVLCCDSIFPGIDDNEVGRVDGICLLLLFAGYIWYMLYTQQTALKMAQGAQATTNLNTRKKNGKKNKALAEDTAVLAVPKTFLTGKPMRLLITVAVVALAAMLVGVNLMLDSATAIAGRWGIPDKVMAVSALAVGVSLPELATCAIAAAKGKPQLAIGNVMGSSVSNLLLVLGFSASCRPIVLQEIRIADFGMPLLVSALAFLFAFIFSRRAIGRIEGIILLVVYFLYIASLWY